MSDIIVCTCTLCVYLCVHYLCLGFFSKEGVLLRGQDSLAKSEKRHRELKQMDFSGDSEESKLVLFSSCGYDCLFGEFYFILT